MFLPWNPSGWFHFLMIYNKFFLLYYKPCKSLKLCLFTQTNSMLWESWAVSNCQDVLTALSQLTSRQCRAAMCGGKHTDPLPHCLPDSILTPPPHLLLVQPIGSTPEKRWSHLFRFIKAWNSLFGSRGKVSSLSSETAKSLSVLKRDGGLVNLSDPTVSFYLPSFGLGSEHSRTLLNDGLCTLSAPGSSEVYGWPIKTLLWFGSSLTHLPSSSPTPSSLFLSSKIRGDPNKLTTFSPQLLHLPPASISHIISDFSFSVEHGSVFCQRKAIMLNDVN